MPPTSHARGDAVRAAIRVLATGFALSLFACHTPPDAPDASVPTDAIQVDDPIPGVSAEMIEPAPLAVASYEGSGQMVHPDALVFPHSWRGDRYWFAATPYPFGNQAFENPSGFVGNDSEDWRTAPGVINPLALPEQGAYLSDPDLSYDPAHDELRLYYRQTKGVFDQIFLKTTRNGADWSVPVLVVQDVRYNVISPAIVREQDGSWRMWAVGARDGGCRVRASALTLTQRRSHDGFTWGSAEPVNLVIPGNVPWHWDVQYVRAKKEYWALVAAFPDGTNCSRSSVYFARSVDGTTWTVSPTPLLAPGVLQPLHDLVYRSSFRYFANDDLVMVWFSGAREEGTALRYSLATARYPLAELLRRVNAPRPASASRLQREADGRARPGAARIAFIDAFP